MPTTYVDKLRAAAVPESMARQFPGGPLVVDVNKAVGLVRATDRIRGELRLPASPHAGRLHPVQVGADGTQHTSRTVVEGWEAAREIRLLLVRGWCAWWLALRQIRAFGVMYGTRQACTMG